MSETLVALAAQTLAPPGCRTPVWPIAVTTGVDVNVLAGDCLVTGWTFKEATGAGTAELWLMDGNNATGVPFAVFTLTAGESVREAAGPWGIVCRSGVFAHIVSGSVLGSVWVADI